MDERRVPGDVAPERESEGRRALPTDAAEIGSAIPADIPVVGIGASAGGLEVFKLLLSDLPVDTGLAIVFIQHLEPNHHSLLAEILARATAMPVSEAADGMPLEANHVYVIPANVDLTIAHGALKLTPRTQTPGSHMPIDRFLGPRPTVRKQGHRGDPFRHGFGRLGGGGGYQSRRRRDLCAGRGTRSSPPCRKLPWPPVAWISCCRRRASPANWSESAGTLILRMPCSWIRRERRPATIEQFGNILAILHGATGIDFSLYREKMIKRRILRRLALRNINSLAEYASGWKSDSVRLKALQRDLLISVTSFFRDPESFECLKSVVFPRIVQGRPANETIRVWVAGCATGEEAFSIAISLQEYLKPKRRRISGADFCFGYQSGGN